MADTNWAADSVAKGRPQETKQSMLGGTGLSPFPPPFLSLVPVLSLSLLLAPFLSLVPVSSSTLSVDLGLLGVPELGWGVDLRLASGDR